MYKYELISIYVRFKTCAQRDVKVIPVSDFCAWDETIHIPGDPGVSGGNFGCTEGQVTLKNFDLTRADCLLVKSHSEQWLISISQKLECGFLKGCTWMYCRTCRSYHSCTCMGCIHPSLSWKMLLSYGDCGVWSLFCPSFLWFTITSISPETSWTCCLPPPPWNATRISPPT